MAALTEEEIQTFAAALNGNDIETFKTLLQTDKDYPSLCNNWPIYRATYHGHIEMVELLLQHKLLDLKRYDPKYPARHKTALLATLIRNAIQSRNYAPLPHERQDCFQDLPRLLFSNEIIRDAYLRHPGRLGDGHYPLENAENADDFEYADQLLKEYNISQTKTTT